MGPKKTMPLTYFEMNVGHIGGTPNVNLHVEGKNSDIKVVRRPCARDVRCVRMREVRYTAPRACSHALSSNSVIAHCFPPSAPRSRARWPHATRVTRRPHAQAMDWTKSSADLFLKGIFSYMNNESLRDLHLSPSLGCCGLLRAPRLWS
jgi:hypothetical protein